MPDPSARVPIGPQSVAAPLSTAAVFLVLTIKAGAQALQQVRGVIADIGGLVRTVGFRDLGGRLSCNVGIGSGAWDRLGRPNKPKQFRPFSEIRGTTHTAVATLGDRLFHIRSDRAHMCFELERLILDAPGDVVAVLDVDADGNEHDTLRDNMPSGRPGQSEFGTYFSGYARNLWVIQKMLIGVPEDQHDRILDFSTAVMGSTLFAPSNTVLQSLGD